LLLKLLLANVGAALMTTPVGRWSNLVGSRCDYCVEIHLRRTHY